MVANQGVGKGEGDDIQQGGTVWFYGFERCNSAVLCKVSRTRMWFDASTIPIAREALYLSTIFCRSVLSARILFDAT